MNFHSPARSAGILVLSTFLAGAPAAQAASSDAPTLWETVKSGTYQAVSGGSGLVWSLYSWMTGYGTGQSRLADDLVSFTTKDLRDLELLVGSTGYRLDTINIHLGTATPDVSLSFAWQRPIDAKRTAELREVIAADNALVDEDARVIVGALLDASMRVREVAPDNFRYHTVRVTLGNPPAVAFDLKTEKNAASLTRAPSMRAATPLPVTFADSESSAARFIPASLTIGSDGLDNTRLLIADAEPVAPRATVTTTIPAAAAAAAAPTPTPVPESVKTAAPESVKMIESVPDAQPPADIVGVAPTAPQIPEAQAPAVQIPTAQIPAETPPAPIPAAVSAAPIPESIRSAESAPPTTVPVAAPPAPEPVTAPAPVIPEPPKVESPKMVEPTPAVIAPPVPAAAPVKAVTAPSYRIIDSMVLVHGRAKPVKSSAVVQDLSKGMVLHKTGKVEGAWLEFTLSGNNTVKFWVHQRMIEEIK